MIRNSPKIDADGRARPSARRKAEAVPRLPRRGGDAPTRELGVAATLSAWRSSFLDGGTAAIQSRPADDRDEVIAGLQAKVSRQCGAGR